MAIILRQICLVARHLRPVEDALARTFSLNVCYRDPAVGQFGLENMLMPVGSQFLEVVAPLSPQAPANRFLDRRGGDGGYMIICQTTEPGEQAAIRARAQDLNVRIVMETAHDGHSFLQFHPADMGGSFLEADWDDVNQPTGRWEPANGTAWRDFVDTSKITAITGATLEVGDPPAIVAKWARILGLPAQSGPNGRREIALANARLIFIHATAGRGDGLAALRINAAAQSGLMGKSLDIGGVRMDIV